MNSKVRSDSLDGRVMHDKFLDILRHVMLLLTLFFVALVLNN